MNFSLQLAALSAFSLDHLFGVLFVFHIVFMNFTLAAPFVVGLMLIVSGEKSRNEARFIAAVHPAAYIFAANIGIALLLMVQVLFREHFFATSKIMNKEWIAVIILLLLSFIGSFLLKMLLNGNRFSARVLGFLSVLIGLMIADIGAAMISNYFVSTNSADWELLRESSSRVHSYSTFFPRLMHFVVGAFAVTGLWMAWIAWWKLRREPNEAAALSLRRSGLRIAAAATALEIMVGIWFLLRLPMDMWQQLFSGSFVSIVWIGGVVCGLLLLGSLVICLLHFKQIIWQNIATMLLFLTLFGMVAGRDLIRIKSFGPDFNLRNLPPIPESDVKIISFILIALLLLTALFTIRLLRKHKS